MKRELVNLFRTHQKRMTGKSAKHVRVSLHSDDLLIIELNGILTTLEQNVLQFDLKGTHVREIRRKLFEQGQERLECELEQILHTRIQLLAFDFHPFDEKIRLVYILDEATE
ncbi:Na-translocating system protein MpsC family protein [Laceyella putida]|uniref:Na-translocating system protein MpsC family protein n=1 Tax=Laceyella putida TaxID=110101 RepID=A0ABW2RQ13_9BACL